MAQKLPLQEFEQIIKYAPLVAIDLVVRTATGKLLLGLRSNEPAKGYFFVPGGRIMKDERIEDAFGRLTEEELGLKQSITEAHSLGVHQHFYATNAIGVQGFGTHYVVLAYELLLEEEIKNLPKSQHSEYQWMSVEQALSDPTVHSNSKAYLETGMIRLESQYQVAADRQSSTSAMLWQTPALVFTAEAFLFTIVTEASTNTAAVKFAISFFGLFIAFASLQLFVRHRNFEKADSKLLEQFEVNNSHKGYAPLHSRAPMKIWNRKLGEDKDEQAPWGEMAQWSSYEVWRIVLMFSVVIFLGFTVYWGITMCK